MYAATANRFEDQNGWSPVNDPEFFEAACRACQVSEEAFIHGLCTKGGPASFWTKMGLSQSTAPDVDTEGLCLQDAKLLVNHLTVIRHRLKPMGSYKISTEDSRLSDSASTEYTDIGSSVYESQCGSPEECVGGTDSNGEPSNLTDWHADSECPPASLVSSDDESEAESYISGRQNDCHPFLCESDDAIHTSKDRIGRPRATMTHHPHCMDVTQMTFGRPGRRDGKQEMIRTSSISSNSSGSSEHTMTEEPYQIHHYF